MVDIHSHILPGLDDGPKTLEDAVAMVKIAAESGTTDIVATPHANARFTFDLERIDRKIAELQAAAVRNRCLKKEPILTRTEGPTSSLSFHNTTLVIDGVFGGVGQRVLNVFKREMKIAARVDSRNGGLPTNRA